MQLHSNGLIKWLRVILLRFHYLHCTTRNEGEMINSEFGRSVRDPTEVSFWHLLAGGPTKPTENLNQDVRFPGRYSSPALPDYSLQRYL
jgi:hypothetical protein